MPKEKHWEYSRRLTELLESARLSQVELARIAGLDPAMISRYIAGREQPTRFPCLIFAGLSLDTENRSYWLSLADVSNQQRELLSFAIAGDATKGLNSYEQELVRAFLAFWYRPQGVVRESIRDLLQKTVFEDIPAPDHKISSEPE